MKSKKPILDYAEPSTDSWIQFTESLIVIHVRRFGSTQIALGFLAFLLSGFLIFGLINGIALDVSLAGLAGWIGVIVVLFLIGLVIKLIVPRSRIQIDLTNRTLTTYKSFLRSRVAETIDLNVFDRVVFHYDEEQGSCSLKGPEKSLELFELQSKEEARDAAREIASRLDLPLKDKGW